VHFNHCTLTGEAPAGHPQPEPTHSQRPARSRYLFVRTRGRETLGSCIVYVLVGVLKGSLPKHCWCGVDINAC